MTRGRPQRGARRPGVRVTDPDGPAGRTPARTEYRPDRLAHAIYTLGSTGRPRGVLVEHRGLATLFNAQIAAFGLTPGSKNEDDTVAAAVNGAKILAHLYEDDRAGSPTTSAGSSRSPSGTDANADS